MKIFVCFFASLYVFPLSAQISWPDKPKNLQVLPRDISRAELESKMFQFSTSLGANCIQCHVAKNWRDFTTYDWASDENPAKLVARKMILMTQRINSQDLPQVNEIRPTSVTVTCNTCHAGKPIPKSLRQLLHDTLVENGVQAVWDRYAELKTQYYGTNTYDFGPNTLNGLGYDLLADSATIPLAISVFKKNVEFYPADANAYDSLGEAYLKAGQKWLALANYTISLQLDPDNRHAKQVYKQITGQEYSSK